MAGSGGPGYCGVRYGSYGMAWPGWARVTGWVWCGSKMRQGNAGHVPVCDGKAVEMRIGVTRYVGAWQMRCVLAGGG